jgi:hypothetical protein
MSRPETRNCLYCGKEFTPKNMKQNKAKFCCDRHRKRAYMDRTFVRIEKEMKLPRKKRPSDFLKRPALKPGQIGTILYWCETHPDSPNAAEIERIMSRLMTPIKKLRKEMATS